MEKHLVEPAAFVLADAGLDRDACAAQNLGAFACDKRIGVQAADKHTADAFFKDRVRAGGRASPVAAWLESNVQVRARRIFHAVFQRVALGMQAAALFVPALTDYAAVFDDHTADHWVGADVSCAARGQFERPAHIVLMDVLQREITSRKARMG